MTPSPVSPPSAAGVRAAPCAGLLLPLLGVFCLALPVPTAAQAGSDAAAVEEVFVDELGCSGCHGRSGEGGVGPTLRESGLSAALFVKQVRLPSDVMPPFSPTLASDAQLAAIYGWLDGSDPVKSPPPVVVEVEVPGDAAPGAETEVGVAARPADGDAGAIASDTPLRLRLTLLARDNAPVAGHAFTYRLPEGGEWLEAETDADGRALLGPEEGVAAGELLGGGDAATRIRIALPAGRHALVVEALDWTRPAAPAVVGLGSEVVQLE